MPKLQLGKKKKKRDLAISLHVKTQASQWLIPKKLSAANLALFFENKLNLVLLELLFAI